MLSRDIVDQICKRSAAGEGVAAILESAGIDVRTGLIYLRDNHPQDIRDAKLVQLDARGEMTEKAVSEHAEMLARVAVVPDSWHHEAIAQVRATQAETAKE